MRWCFASPQLADAFCAKFGGSRMDVARLPICRRADGGFASTDRSPGIDVASATMARP
jgi:hypothetical protein